MSKDPNGWLSFRMYAYFMRFLKEPLLLLPPEIANQLWLSVCWRSSVSVCVCVCVCISAYMRLGERLSASQSPAARLQACLSIRLNPELYDAHICNLYYHSIRFCHPLFNPMCVF